MIFRTTLMLCLFAADDSAVRRDDHLIKGIEQAQLAREEGIAGYSVMERYALNNSRFNESAEMTVAVSYTKGEGKVYRVVSRKGPSFLQSSVFDRVLKEEIALSFGNSRLAALVIPANYQMKWIGRQMLEGRNCEVVELEPRKKSLHLLRGKAWVDAASFKLIRIEGKPTASPTFWASSPLVVRDYIEIGDFSFASRSHALSQSFLLGRSELNVEYSDYQISTAGIK